MYVEHVRTNSVSTRPSAIRGTHAICWRAIFEIEEVTRKKFEYFYMHFVGKLGTGNFVNEFQYEFG